MRGVYSMGALTALEDRGLRHAFGRVIGASAGAINGAYLLAGQAHDAVSVYVDLLSNRKFVNFWRIHRIVDMDFLVDQALRRGVPLDVETLLASPSTLEVVLTDADTAKPVVVTSRDRNLDLYEVFRATGALPGLYNKRVRVGEREYVDGGVVDAVPVVYAAETGATAVLAVLTRSPGFRRKQEGWLYRQAASLLARGQSAAVRAVLGIEDSRFNAAMDILEGKVRLGTAVEHWSVWPGDLDRLVGRTTFDKARLRACAEMGRADMESVLQSAYPDASDAEAR